MSLKNILYTLNVVKCIKYYMEIKVVLCPESDCVYYISGSFFDGKEFVTESDNVLAVTVMPLTVRYVPYTFKLIGGRAEGGKALSCECDGKVYVKIPMQSLLLFSDGRDPIPSDCGSNFFSFVRCGAFNEALNMLSSDFKLTNEDLKAFFADYIADIRLRDYYILIDASGKGHRCFLSMAGEKIDNISIE